MTNKFNLTAEERMKKNILNGLDENTPIFRFIRTSRLFDLFNTQKIVLVKPWKWEDPFENFLSKTIVVNNKNERIGFNVTNDFFGQCWTIRDECDGIWRNYSSLEDGVRIETTPNILLSSIYDFTSKGSIISYFIGKVIYNPDHEIISLLSDWISQMLLDTSGKEVAKMLLIKREEFSYESEVRLLYSEKGTENKDVVDFNVDPFDLIKNIMFSPKMEQKEFETHKGALIKLGFSEDRISQSKLYKPYYIQIPYDDL